MPDTVLGAPLFSAVNSQCAQFWHTLARSGTRLQLVSFWGAGLIRRQGQSRQQVQQDGQKVSGPKLALACG